MNEEFEELILEMKSSLRRAEHSCYVSLKYTRTVDVIQNLVTRFIETLTLGMDVLIMHLKEQRKILENPETLIEKVNTVADAFPEDEHVQDAANMLLFLRKVIRSEVGKCEEYRRHVTLCVNVEGKEYNIDIDLLSEYFHRVEASIKRVEEIIK